MPRIVYSCCGEGRGHSSRTLTMVRLLRERGHEVRVLASHAAFHALQPQLPEVSEIPGLILVYERNRVRIGPTLRRNLATWRGKGVVVRRLKTMLEEFRPQLAITDFEPFLPLAARQLGIPFIAIDHQHVIPGLPIEKPLRYWPHFAATLAVVLLTHRGERANLVTSYFHPDRPYRPHYHYFGPILRPEVSCLRPAPGDHVLVYQTSGSFSRLPEILQAMPFQFRVYAFNRDGREGNCLFKPRNHPDFLADLAGCSWVLTNGGYTLISESLHLGKPILSIPVEGQFEQWINAAQLARLGYGLACTQDELSPALVARFVQSLDARRHRLSQSTFDGTAAILERTLSFL